MPKSLVSSLITFIFLLFGCTRNNMPSDHQMLENFSLNESEFERLRNISIKYDRFHYPPYNETESTAYTISYKDKKELDSLIKKLNIMSIQYDGISEVCLLFHTYGISVSGGYKEYIYAPNLEDNIKNYDKEVALDPTTEMYIIERITKEDLEQVSQRYSVKIELYRPIKNGWYIHISREN